MRSLVLTTGELCASRCLKHPCKNHMNRFQKHPWQVGALLVYDITREGTFKSCAKWMEVRRMESNILFPTIFNANSFFRSCDKAQNQTS